MRDHDCFLVKLIPRRKRDAALDMEFPFSVNMAVVPTLWLSHSCYKKKLREKLPVVKPAVLKDIIE
jgi:hypothetical protein